LGYIAQDFVELGAADLLELGVADLVKFGSEEVVEFVSTAPLELAAEELVELGSATKLSVCVAFAVPFVMYPALILIVPVAISNILIVLLNSCSAAIG